MFPSVAADESNARCKVFFSREETTFTLAVISSTDAACSSVTEAILVAFTDISSIDSVMLVKALIVSDNDAFPLLEILSITCLSREENGEPGIGARIEIHVPTRSYR